MSQAIGGGHPCRKGLVGADDGHPFRDRAWSYMVGVLDAALRRHYGVYEYSEMPACVFRIAVTRARHPALLADGTLVHEGAPIGVLHLWNENLTRFSPAGPDLRWAKVMQGRVRRSLEELCRHVETSPAWAEVTAIRADAALPARILAGPQLRRVARRFGFEPRRASPPPRARLSLVGENLLLWGFARAYNPGALSRQNLLRGRQELWLSRTALIANYSDRSGFHHSPSMPRQDAA